MARIHRLTAARLNSLKKVGLHNDGGNLLFRVAPGGTKSWVLRYSLNGRTRDMGLGRYPEIGLAEAREQAFNYRKMLTAKIDPIEHRNAERSAARVFEAKHITFDDCARAYVDAHESGWRSHTHATQWRGTLTSYASPVFGKLPVSSIDTGLVVRALQPIWTDKPVTASRLRGRIESVLDWARANGYRLGENPARWRGHLDHLLPAQKKVRAVQHHAALPYSEIGAFMAQLRDQSDIKARALEFTILTAARTGEVLRATWTEIDFASKTWAVPAARMKSGREHRVPLTDAAIAVLEFAASIKHSDYIFPGRSDFKPLGTSGLQNALLALNRRDVTAHGFRSTFRDWAAERTSFPPELAELSLAHAVGSDVERAYRRTDLFDKRRRLMEEWAKFCGRNGSATVVPLRGVS